MKEGSPQIRRENNDANYGIYPYVRHLELIMTFTRRFAWLSDVTIRTIICSFFLFSKTFDFGLKSPMLQTLELHQ
jgi:hypothetical protein